MARKKRTSLPRVTVLAYDRRELVAFVAAVETLRLLVDDLRIMLNQKKAKRAIKTTTAPNGKDGEPCQPT